MPELKDFKPGDKVVFTLGPGVGLYTFKKGGAPDSKKPKEALPEGDYEFTCIKTPSGGAGDNWFVTEYPKDSGVLYGIAAGFLLRLAGQAGSNVFIKKALDEKEPPEPLSMEH